jgi:hypothetical protein
MSDYEWLDIYRQADDEQDISKLHQRVMDAESAIFARMQRLSEGPQSEIDVQTETLAMRSALNGLLRIKTERLGWPSLGLEDAPGETAP